MFFICVNQMMGAIFGTLLTFEMEALVFLREYGDKSYGIIPYFLSKTIIEIPFMFIFPIIFTSITYFAVGFEAQVDKFFFFAFAMCMIVICASSYGMVISAVFKHAAPSFAYVLMFPLILLGGFFANAGAYPSYITWI